MGLFGVARQTEQTQSSTSLSNLSLDNKPLPTFNPFPKQTESTALTPHTKIQSVILTDHSVANQTLSESPDSKPQQPSINDLVGNADTQVKLGLAHDKALDTLVSAVDLMKMKLDDIKPDKLPSVIAATSKVVDQIQRQRIDSVRNKDKQEVHYHFYTPTQKKMEDYEVIDVG